MTVARWAAMMKKYCPVEQAHQDDNILEDLVCLFGLSAPLSRKGSFGVSLVGSRGVCFGAEMKMFPPNS